MEYQVISVILNGSPVRKDSNTFQQSITIKTRIVGNEYPEFDASDSMVAEFPASGSDANGIEALLKSQADTYVANKYKNTSE